MTITQFLKKYVPKDRQAKAEEDLIVLIAEEANSERRLAIKGVCGHLRGVLYEIRDIYS